MSPYALF